jgi:hypothetical protein
MARALAAADDAFSRIAAIGGMVVPTPCCSIQGNTLGCELQLQQLLPHHFLFTAQIGDVDGEHARRNRSGGAAHQLVHHASTPPRPSMPPRGSAGAVPTVATYMERAPRHVAMHRRYRPDAPRGTQDGDFWSALC